MCNVSTMSVIQHMSFQGKIMYIVGHMYDFTTNSGWMAERSKALRSGRSLFEGAGSNPASIKILF